MIKQTILFSGLCTLVLLLFSVITFSQNNFKVSGKVSDETGKPVGGATVQVKGTNIGTATLPDGSYTLMAPSGGSTLVISSVGYTDQEIAIGNKSEVNVSIASTASSLQDVVVVGYATVKKKDVTGSVSSINQNDIKSRPVGDVLQAMQGKVAGVDISSNERPGQLGSVFIRGVRSLATATNTGSLNAPLYVVDNIPLATGGIDNLNPGDIETIDVLKDASATAIYGSRGANGVIIITTKQGKAGKMTIGLNTSMRFDNIVDNQKMFNAGDYITFKRWANYYAGLNQTTGISTNPRGDQPTIAKDQVLFAATADPSAWANILKGWASGTWDGSKVTTTDWRGMVQEQSITSDNVLSISGGTDKIKAYGSFGYLNNTGTIKGQSYKRYTAKASVDFTPNKWFSFGSSLNINYNLQEFGQSNFSFATIGGSAGGLYESARSIYPYAVPYDSAGNRILLPGGDPAIKSIVDEWTNNRDQRVTLRALGSFYAQVNIGSIFPLLKGLKYRVNFGPDISNFRDGNYVDAKSVANGGSTNYAALTKSNTGSYTLDHLLYYDKSVKQHSFGITLLHSQTAYQQERTTVTGNGVPIPSQLWNALQSGTVTGAISNSSFFRQYQLLSGMARVNYGFKDKYLLTASIRRDGSSVFAPGRQYSSFPSLALAWRVSKESFMLNSKWINDLKLRFGIGVTGNSAVDPYTTQGGVVSLFYPFGGSNAAGSIPSSTLANQLLGWERTTQNNIGLDYSLFKRRVSGSIDVYSSKSSDLLMNRNITPVTGYSLTVQNIGKTANQGIDINITTANIQNNNFSWTTTINAAWQKEHIVALANGNDITNGWFLGQPVGIIYGYRASGLWQKADSLAMKAFASNAFTPGSVRPIDLNKDNKIDPNNDRSVVGWTRPRWVVGMTNSFTYKNFDFSIFLYGRLHYMYNYGGEGQAARSVNREINYYNENNFNAEFQKPVFNAGGASQDAYFSALGYLNGSFIKIRNISLGYTFGGTALANKGVSNLKAYMQMTNPGMLFSKTKFLDMDVVGPTWNRGITIGLNVSF